jgi:hypothetical protein
VKPVIIYNLAAYEVLELSWDALKMRYAAIHIVMLPITVRAPWRATRTYGSRQKDIVTITKAKKKRSRTVWNTTWTGLCFCLFFMTTLKVSRSSLLGKLARHKDFRKEKPEDSSWCLLI